MDFEPTDYQEKLVSPKCAVCNTELEVDLKEQLNAYRCFCEGMSSVSESSSECAWISLKGQRLPVNCEKAVSTAVEVQQSVTTAFEKELAIGG